MPLVEGDEVLTVLPGDPVCRMCWPPGSAATDSAAIMKLGRTFSGVCDAVAWRRAGWTRPGT